MAKARHIPGVEKAGLLKRKSFVEAISVGPPVVIAGVGSSMSPDPIASGFLALGAIWLFIAAVVKVLHAREQDKEARGALEHDGLLGALHVLQTSVAQHCGFPHPIDKKLRVTIHRVVPPKNAPKNLAAATEIEQIVPYVGGDGGGQGRRFSIRSGITGHAIRTGGPCSGARQSDDEVAYVKEQIAEWSFTQHDAEQLCRGRYSFMAIPIQNGQQVLGVVYLDSSEREVFAGTEVAEVIVAACGGINRYVEERY